MKPHLEEARLMLQLADRDIAAFAVLSQVNDIHLSVICFHAQQAIEKCLKSALFLHHIEFRRTHDLDLLVSLLDENGVSLPLTQEQATSLNPCAVVLRYDDVEFEIGPLDISELEDLVAAVRRWAGALFETQKDL